jgi:2-keto-4-pentenoate hydratase
MIGIEAEIAFRFARDLPPRAAPYADDEVAAAVGEALVTIEICDTRLAGWKTAPALWKLADLQSNAALVTGSARADWRDVDFAVQPAELWIDGERRVAVQGSHATVNPFRIVPWMANHCAARSGGLREGDVVTAGSWTGITFVDVGAAIRAAFPGIGEAHAAIAR